AIEQRQNVVRGFDGREILDLPRLVVHDYEKVFLLEVRDRMTGRVQHADIDGNQGHVDPNRERIVLCEETGYREEEKGAKKPAATFRRHEELISRFATRKRKNRYHLSSSQMVVGRLYNGKPNYILSLFHKTPILCLQEC